MRNNSDQAISRDILAGLNGPQVEAVCHTEGPLLILAGAGSGKTMVLMHRIAYLLQQGVPPRQILAVTFTNKAAGEMRQRIARLVGPVAESIWVFTFHTACVRILRQEIERLGYANNFVIFDSQDQLILVKRVLKQLQLDDQSHNPKALLAAISRAKNELIGPEQYQQQTGDYWSRNVAEVYRHYQEQLHQNNGLDFDDLIRLVVRLFREFPEVLAQYQERFHYIMVDEYQDTNHAQYTLVNLLAAKYRNLCVVGDDDQSIYSFRSADIRNILEFERDFPEAKVIKLEQNYRSTQNILDAANEVIKNNRGRHPKRLWTENQPGEKLGLFAASDDREEAWLVTEEITRLVQEEGYHYQDFALLYRINAQSRSFEEALIQRGIPYRVIGGLRFYERKEIKDILAFLRLVHNPSDRVSLGRVINLPKRGIGEASLERFLYFLSDNNYSAVEGFAHLADLPGLTTRALRPLAEFGRLLTGWVEQQNQLTVKELTEAILEQSGYSQALKDEATIEAQGRLENLEEFIALTLEFEKNSDDRSLAAFLETVALVADIDNYQSEAEALVLMTLHSAKGLEFPAVFMVGLEEGLFPHSRALLEPKELEEERRLCYVGLTRARRRVYLSYANQRVTYGSYTTALPSRFLMELPGELLVNLRPTPERARPAVAGSKQWQRAATNTAPVMPASPPEQIQIGCKVRHPKWGIGTVVTREGSGENIQIKVAFPGLGIKSLLLAYAPLQKVEQP